MKQIFLVILGALAIASSANAGPSFDAQVRALADQAKRDAIDQANLDTEHALRRQIEVNTQIAIEQEAREEQAAAQQYAQEQAEAQAIANAKAKAVFIAGQKAIAQRHEASSKLSDGDQTPLSNRYDDAATIKMYLHDSGYTDLSDAQIANVIAYMKANGIHHVSELSELTKALEAKL